jgi:3-dehydroquinate dehydratase-1
LPLVATDQNSLLEQAAEVCSFDPDVIEWRVDKFEAVLDTDAVLAALGALREAIGNIPLIFTCRVIHEGGFQEIAAEDRLRLNKAVIASGQVDLIDTEMSNARSHGGRNESRLPGKPAAR